MRIFQITMDSSCFAASEKKQKFNDEIKEDGKIRGGKHRGEVSLHFLADSARKAKILFKFKNIPVLFKKEMTDE